MGGKTQPTQGQIDARPNLMSHQSDYSLLDFLFVSHLNIVRKDDNCKSDCDLLVKLQ